MTTEDTRVLYARQPIYDRTLELAGFELLFRGGEAVNAVPAQFDGNVATSQVLINAFTESDIDTVCSHKPAYVNFTADALDTGVPFSPHKLVIEVLETVTPTAAVIAAVKRLHEAGYRIALDDYAQRDAAHPLLAYADIVKLEYPQFAPTELTAAVAALKRARPGVTVLAEKIETRQDFETCRAAGCDLFQGYFLARPEPVRGRAIPVDRLNVMRLLAILNDPEVDIDEITNVISRAPFLGVRLLKLVNSAFYCREISSLRWAIMTLGMTRIRAYASLLALSQLHDKPHALQQIAATRGFVCQLLSESLPDGPERGFTVGLFSCLDAFFDRSLADIIASVPLSKHITQALLTYKGALGTILHSVIHHEQGRLDCIRWEELAGLGLGPEHLMAAFEQGISLANKAPV